jgi:paraquat-inducible protein B
MLQSAKIPELIADLRRLVNDLDHDVKDVDMGALSNDARALIHSAQQDVDALTASLVRTSGTADTALKSGDQMFQEATRTVVAIRPLIATLENTAKRADALVAAMQDTIEPGSPLQRELITTLREVSNAARSARALADDLQRNPNSILFGKAGGSR